MSYLTIGSLVKDGRAALNQGNYWSALSLALMLPSICSRIEYDSVEFKGDKDSVNDSRTNRYYYIKRDGSRKWADKKAYESWCKKYIVCGVSYLNVILGKDAPAILYLLRCDLVHAGIANLLYNQKRIFLSCGNSGATDLSSRLIISVHSLCEDMFRVVEKWVQDNGADTIKSTFVFDFGHFEDKLLYNELCKEEYAASLKTEFNNFEANSQ